MKKIRVKFDGPVLDEAGQVVPLLFDCPWFGHIPDPTLVVRNKMVPNFVGTRCTKCGCALWNLMEQSQIVGADGAPLANA